MRVVCVYRDGEDYTRTVQEWIAEFERRTGKEIEIISPDGRDGVEFCKAYDVVEYPTMMALDESGGVLAGWRGVRELPTFDEASYWL